MRAMQQKLKRMEKELAEKKDIQLENQTLKMQLKENRQQFLDDYFKNGIAEAMEFLSTSWYTTEAFRNSHLEAISES